MIQYVFFTPTTGPIYTTLNFMCPTLSRNSVEVSTTPGVSVQATFYAKSGSDVFEPIEEGKWGAANDYPGFGHPLAVYLVIKF